MVEQNKYDTLVRLIETILKVDRNDLRTIQMILKHLEGQQSLDSYSSSKSSSIERSKENEKIQLIGTLPFVLLDEKYFPENKMLASFAQKYLGVQIPSVRKRSRNEIIGTIIVEVSKKDDRQISTFTQALTKIMGKREKGEISNFFLEWEKIIRET